MLERVFVILFYAHCVSRFLTHVFSLYSVCALPCPPLASPRGRPCIPRVPARRKSYNLDRFESRFVWRGSLTHVLALTCNCVLRRSSNRRQSKHRPSQPTKPCSCKAKSYSVTRLLSSPCLWRGLCTLLISIM